MPQELRASVCGPAADVALAAIRYALLSALRSTFPARRPQTEANPLLNHAFATITLRTLSLFAGKLRRDFQPQCGVEFLQIQFRWKQFHNIHTQNFPKKKEFAIWNATELRF